MSNTSELYSIILCGDHLNIIYRCNRISTKSFIKDRQFYFLAESEELGESVTVDKNYEAMTDCLLSHMHSTCWTTSEDCQTVAHRHEEVSTITTSRSNTCSDFFQ